MTRVKTAPLTAFVCVAIASAAHGQSDTASARPAELALFAGVSQGARLETTASPRTFGGPGFAASLDFHRSFSAQRWTFASSIGTDLRRFRPTVSGEGGDEQLVEGNLSTMLLRRISGGGGAASNFSMGLATELGVTRTVHRYADPASHISDFMFTSATMGPAVAWTRSIRGGVANIELSSPLIGLVDHPYADYRGNTFDRVRVATAAELRGFSGTLRYAPAERAGFGLIYAYHFDLTRYADIQPMRSASQSFSIGIRKRFGSR
jgi:hypothetical protein